MRKHPDYNCFCAAEAEEAKKQVGDQRDEVEFETSFIHIICDGVLVETQTVNYEVKDVDKTESGYRLIYDFEDTFDVVLDEDLDWDEVDIDEEYERNEDYDYSTVDSQTLVSQVL